VRRSKGTEAKGLGGERVTKRISSPSYWRTLESTWRRHVEPRWGMVAVAAIRHSEVQSWVSGITEAGLSPSTALRAYGILAAVLDVAVKDRRVLSNPARGVRLPRKLKREHTYLTDAQVSALALASGRRGVLVLVLVLAYCGLRWGEAIGLRVKDLDLLRRRANVTVNAVEVGGEIIVGTPKSQSVGRSRSPRRWRSRWPVPARTRGPTILSSPIARAYTCGARSPTTAGSATL
jgi:integrase